MMVRKPTKYLKFHTIEKNKSHNDLYVSQNFTIAKETTGILKLCCEGNRVGNLVGKPVFMKRTEFTIKKNWRRSNQAVSEIYVVL